MTSYTSVLLTLALVALGLPALHAGSIQIAPTGELQAVNSQLAESRVVGSVLCPDRQSYCPDGNTCCLMPNHQWVCCPLPYAACCADGYHCCPHGYRCDSASFRCTSLGSVVEWLESIKSPKL